MTNELFLSIIGLCAGIFVFSLILSIVGTIFVMVQNLLFSYKPMQKYKRPEIQEPSRFSNSVSTGGIVSQNKTYEERLTETRGMTDGELMNKVLYSSDTEQLAQRVQEERRQAKKRDYDNRFNDKETDHDIDFADEG
jgi:hypothetical protein